MSAATARSSAKAVVRAGAGGARRAPPSSAVSCPLSLLLVPQAGQQGLERVATRDGIDEPALGRLDPLPGRARSALGGPGDAPLRHVAAPVRAQGVEESAYRRRLAAPVYRLLALLGVSREHRPSSTELDEVLANGNHEARSCGGFSEQ